MTAITITVPKSQAETWYEEIKEAARQDLSLFFKVPNLPVNVNLSDKCYVIIDNQIIGYHLIKGLYKTESDWTCQITKTKWSAGKYIIRDARSWTPIEPIKSKSHRGFRYYND